ncbi:MAG TPA: hypothetical protein VFE98_10815 [Candidatus Bathyarchaeia archaeon]|nr:hypothetical protein [Candidatus Bathyarchaeia archaeon]
MPQDGVGAIFTKSRVNNDARATATLVSFGLGAGLWTWALRAFSIAGSIGSATSPLVLFVIGSAFITAGTGVSAYFMGRKSTTKKSVRSRRLKTKTEASAALENLSNPVLDSVRNVGRARRESLGIRLPRVSLIVILQSIVLVSLYSWLVQEYLSNAKMQTWFGSNVIFARAFFSYEAVAVSAIVMLVLAFESLPGRRLSRPNY